MKIDERIRSIYESQRVRADGLKKLVDQDISKVKRPSWHYESRPKELESFALKLEAGRIENPSSAEDVFACVVVVPNYSDIPIAERAITDLYGKPEQRRPPTASETSKLPSDFRFDDVRLYMIYKDQGFTPPSGFAGTLFEVQIRTFLQHAWTVATHDVVYKADDVNWRRERIAFQARAALEQVEVAIADMALLEKSAALPEGTAISKTTNSYITILKRNWSKDELPRDVRRLAESLVALMKNVHAADPTNFEDLLDVGRIKYGGAHNLDWSPYRAVLQYVAEQRPDELKTVLKQKKRRDKIFVYAQVMNLLGLSNSAPGAIVLPQ